MKKYLFILMAIMAIAIVVLFQMVIHLTDQRDRLNSNQDALMDTVSIYKTKAGDYAASVQALQLTKKELESNCSDLTQKIKSLNIKLKRVESAAKTATETKVEIMTVVKDSIVYRDRIDTVQIIKWTDPWVRIDGEIDNGNLSMDVQSTDTLTQVIWRVPKQWCIFKWGTKAIRQEIVSSNPHTKIVYTEYIELTNKRGKKR